MREFKAFYRGIDTLSYSAVMPPNIYEEFLKIDKEPGKGPFRIFFHDPMNGYTVRVGHVSDNQRKVSQQGGYSAFVNLHSLACYNRDFGIANKYFHLKGGKINRIDFAVDMQNSVPNPSKVKVTRQKLPMVVPKQSITYGWGTKYKSLTAIFYDKLADIAAGNGEKNYLLDHYKDRDKRTGVTRFEIRVMKEFLKRTGQEYFIQELTFPTKHIGSAIKKCVERVKMSDRRYPQFHENISKEIDTYFSLDINVDFPRVKEEYDVSQLSKQMIGIAAAIIRKSPRFKEIVEGMNAWQFVPELMVGMFREHLHMPHGLTKCEDLFVRISEAKRKREIGS